MSPGQSFSLSAFLPKEYSGDDFYTLLVAIAAFFLVWSIGKVFFVGNKLDERMRIIQQRRTELKTDMLNQRRRKKPETNKDWMRTIVTQFKVLKKNQVEGIQLKLVQAGYRSKDAIVVYAFMKLTMPFVFLAGGLIVADIDWNAPFAEPDMWKWLIVIGGGFLGTRLPEILLRNQKQKRGLEIQKSLADTLDLMLICAEAGLSLVAALDRVARELGQAYPEMAEELSLTSVEIGFLPERNTALKHFAERVDLPEVRSMVNVLLQTEKYGTPVAQALRVLSREFRTQRMLRAEQKAAKLPAIMTVPMIVFILPTLFVIVLTPAMIGVMDAF